MAKVRTGSRKSIYRVLADFIKADGNIAADEISLLEELCGYYSILDEDRRASYSMTLAEAAMELTDMPKTKRDQLIRKLEESSMIDGECCREESLMIAALETAWEGKGKIISVPLDNRLLLHSQMIYLDSKYNPQKNDLDRKFEEIKKIAELADYELIYMPQVAKEYKEYGVKNLEKMLKVLNPSLDDEKLTDNATSLSEMTSRSFFLQIMNDRLQMGLDLHDDKPCIMISLPNNVISGKDYANYLLYYVSPNTIGKQIQSFIDVINSRMGSYSVIVNRRGSRSRDFPYKGFHKVLLDLMSCNAASRCEVKVYARGGNDPIPDKSPRGMKFSIEFIYKNKTYPVHINGRDAAYYLLLLCGSASKEGAVHFERSLKGREKVQKQYSEAYRLLSYRECAPDITLSENLRPVKSRVMDQLNKCGLKECLHLLKPTKKGANCYYIPVPPENVSIVTGHGEVLLKDSRLFKEFF